MFVSKFQLHLFPENPETTLPQNELINALATMAFIGDAEDKVDHQDTRFLTGEKFLSHLCFLGCSPDIEFIPNSEDPDSPYIYIEIPETNPIPQFTSGVNVKAPRCSECKKELTELATFLEEADSISKPDKAHCQHCNAVLAIDRLNWRRTAYSSRTCIIIHNIYESEAVPDDLLLDQLYKLTQSKWKYAYIRIA